jgi:ribosomal protein L2
MHLSKSLTPNSYFKLVKIPSSKGEARSSTIFQNFLPLNFRYKKLTTFIKSKAGRNSHGTKTLRTRGSIRIKRSKLAINFTCRFRNVNFIAGFYFTPLYNRLISLLFLSSGSVVYNVTTSEHRLFILQKFYLPYQNLLAKKMHFNEISKYI